ncbi:anthocyanidin 5,3-O-glucosyltransferase-like [Macadamia integrifolia]|uniref:anthocyanidin 5,3-O-glucosyltransferase-like n=1 Tax=Macadamia integrifolia TaxID=60698 RepID=UPI001C4E9ADE|nr:anthocyanidin 5,3-O-glucosyltransferase-like [Macadamia integrifolia]
MKDNLVLYPSPGIGHLVSTVELGRLILKEYPSFSVTILITPPPFNTGSTGPYITRISATTPSISFHHLPPIPISPESISSPHFEAIIFEVSRRNNPNVHQALLTISQSSTIRALIIDTFCSPARDVAASLNIPVYNFFTSGATTLSVMLYFPTIHKNTTKSFKDLGSTILDIPGTPPIPAKDMVKPLLDRNDEAYQGFLEFYSRMPESKGILINTFESLQPRALKALSAGLCLPDSPTPPIYCVGPIITADDRTGGEHGEIHECLTWLDSQPSRSVVFLCFGSLGLFSAAQLKEIAIGLEKSGQRFLWVVRNPPTEDKSWRHLVPPEPDLDALLPEGFLERTKDRGFVVKLWAPQMEVLNRESVGGFVTHCGWNSVLEGVCAGVPMIAWPLYAEQRLNRIFLVEEAKLAIPMNESEDGFVSAAEVEKRVRELMESDEGKALRERTMALRDAAVAATSEGGSSRAAFSEVAELWKSSS